jgi:hypothetical protein
MPLVIGVCESKEATVGGRPCRYKHAIIKRRLFRSHKAGNHSRCGLNALAQTQIIQRQMKLQEF